MWEDAWFYIKPLIRYKKYKWEVQWALFNQGEKVEQYDNKNEAMWEFKKLDDHQIRNQLRELQRKLNEAYGEVDFHPRKIELVEGERLVHATR